MDVTDTNARERGQTEAMPGKGRRHVRRHPEYADPPYPSSTPRSGTETPIRPPTSRAVAALVTGVATAVHYALPDLIDDRRTRGWAKTGIIAVAVAGSVPELRTTWTSARRTDDDGRSLSGAFRSLPPARKAVALTPVVAVVGASVGWLAVLERWTFRRGQARAAAGKRFPHTGPALLYGVLAGAIWFVEPPAGRD